MPKHTDSRSLRRFLALGLAVILTVSVFATAPIAAEGHSGFYRVRTEWNDSSSQLGAYLILNNAINMAGKNPNHKVYDSNGLQVWPEQTTAPAPVNPNLPAPAPATPTANTASMYYIRPSWADWRGQIAAFKNLSYAKVMADKNPGYVVYDQAGVPVYPTSSGDAEVVVVPAPVAPVEPAPQTPSVAPPVETVASKNNLSKIDNSARGWSWTAGHRWQDVMDRYNAAYMAPDRTSKVIYLSFDCGYEYNGNTAKILDILKVNNVKASFFLNDGFVRYASATTRRMAKEGHAVGNHGYKHLNMPATLASSESAAVLELTRLEDHYKQVTGRDLDKIYRPSSGNWSERTLAFAQNQGYRTYLWSFAYRDWDTSNQLSPAWSLEQLKGATKPGAIIELHAVSNTNVQIMGEYIQWAQAQGYTFATLTN